MVEMIWVLSGSVLGILGLIWTSWVTKKYFDQIVEENQDIIQNMGDKEGTTTFPVEGQPLISSEDDEDDPDKENIIDDDDEERIKIKI